MSLTKFPDQYHKSHLSQRLEANIGELMTSGHFECAQMRIIVSQSYKCRIGEFSALANAELP